MWTAAILAGGRASRFGGADKSSLVVGGRSILDRQLDVLANLTPHVFMVSRSTSLRWETRTPVVLDRTARAGPLGGIYTALLEAPTDQVLVLACDMPFITAPFLSRLMALGNGPEAVVPCDASGRHPLCASYTRRIADRLEERLGAGNFRVLDALDALDVRDVGPDELAEFDPDGRLLMNINTPDDYARACAAAEGDRSSR
jgi:molybdopterin-guanine dinucleotide biosynthesis protein A